MNNLSEDMKAEVRAELRKAAELALDFALQTIAQDTKRAGEDVAGDTSFSQTNCEVYMPSGDDIDPDSSLRITITFSPLSAL